MTMQELKINDVKHCNPVSVMLISDFPDKMASLRGNHVAVFHHLRRHAALHFLVDPLALLLLFPQLLELKLHLPTETSNFEDSPFLRAQFYRNNTEDVKNRYPESSNFYVEYFLTLL